MGKTAVEIATILIEALDDKEIEAVKKMDDTTKLEYFGTAGADVLKEVVRLTKKD